LIGIVKAILGAASSRYRAPQICADIAKNAGTGVINTA